MPSFYTAAQNLHAAGLNVVPVNKTESGSYRPVGKWSNFQTIRQSQSDLKQLFSIPHDGIAIVCGKGSGNLEMIDVDSKNSLIGDHEYNKEVKDYLFNILPTKLFQSLVFETTKSNGLHIYYRCKNEVPGNQKLVERYATPEESKDGASKKVLIETRGQGGLSFCQPTPGYELEQGAFEDIPIIESIERAMIIETIRQRCEVNPPVIEFDPQTKSKANASFKIKPWEDYDSKLDILNELTERGWEIVDEDEQRIFVKRPGTDAQQSGNVLKKNNSLWMWSSNTPFPTEKPISPTAAYAYLNYPNQIDGDDITRALSKTFEDFVSKGYGERFNSTEEKAVHDIKELHEAGKSKKQILARVDKEYNGNVPGSIDTENLYQKAIEALKAQESLSKKRNGPFWGFTKTGSVKIKSAALRRYSIEKLGYRIYYPVSNSSDFDIVKLDKDKRTIENRMDQQFIGEIQMLINHWRRTGAYNVDFDELDEAFDAKKDNLFKDTWYNLFLEARKIKNAHRYKDPRIITDYNEIEIFSILESTKNKSYSFFKNGYVEVTKDGYELVPYESMPANHYVWKEQIIDEHISEFKQIEMTPAKVAASKWFQFLRRISGLDKTYDKYGLKYDIKEIPEPMQQRWLATATITGFLCHDYKDTKYDCAIALQEDTDDPEKGGGTGKGLYFKAINCLRKVTEINGKTFDPNDNFAYQKVELDTKVVLLDDITRNLDVEAVNNHITGGFDIRKLYKPVMSLGFKNSPKVAITTNYTLKGSANHFTRRWKFLLISPHFSPDYRPINEVGRLYEWKKDDEQWHLFYNLAFCLISMHLNKGIIETKDTSALKIKKIKNKYGELFYEWMSHWVQDAGRNVDFETKQLHEAFKDQYSSNLGYFNFNEGLEKYCDLFGIECEMTTGTSGTLKNRKVFILRSDQPSHIDEEDLPF